MPTQSKKKHRRLLEKAQELFYKYGYSGVSMDQIASEAGISKMTIYKHFPSKEELFIETLFNDVERHMKILMEKLNEKYHTFEKMEYLYEYMMQTNNQITPILIKDVMERPIVFERVRALKYEKGQVMWRNILADGVRKGEIRPLDVEFVSRLLLNMPMAFIDTDYFTDEKNRLVFYENFFDFIKYGMLGGIETPQDTALKEAAHHDAERSDASAKPE